MNSEAKSGWTPLFTLKVERSPGGHIFVTCPEDNGVIASGRSITDALEQAVSAMHRL